MMNQNNFKPAPELIEINIDVNTLYHIAKEKKQSRWDHTSKTWRKPDKLQPKSLKRISEIENAWNSVVIFCDLNMHRLHLVTDDICAKVSAALELERKYEIQ